MSIVSAREHLQRELKGVEDEARRLRGALKMLDHKAPDSPRAMITAPAHKVFKRSAASRKRMSDLAKQRWAAIKKGKTKTPHL